MNDWPVEEIPDKDDLFFRGHRTFLKGGSELRPAIFKARKGGISTDWSAYSSPERCRVRADEPESNGVVTLPVGSVRASRLLTVVHTPDQERNNRSHTDVLGIPDEGPDKEEARLHLFDAAMATGGWTIHPDAPVEDPET